MAIADLMTPLKRQTLSTDVYEQLKNLLISGQMMPGEQISLRSTANALGVSVMPVREAIQRLVAEQALEVGPNRALRIPMMSVGRLREITMIRKNLEGLATKQASLRLNQVTILQIEALSAEFAGEMLRKPADGARLIAVNQEFHFAIYRGADMPMLLQLIEALWLRIGPILNYDLRSSSSMRVSSLRAVEHHRNLVEALKQRDSIAACTALQADIDSAADFIIAAGVLVVADEVESTPP